LRHSTLLSSEPTRRSYIGWLIGLCGAAVTAVLSVPLIRFTLFPLTAPLTRTVMVEQVDG
jgi:hypothetical protein